MRWKHLCILVLIPWVFAQDMKNIHSPCRILLNEFSTTATPFAEVGKFCPPKKENNQDSLAGYYVMVLDAEDLTLVEHKNLQKLKLQKAALSDAKDLASSTGKIAGVEIKNGISQTRGIPSSNVNVKGKAGSSKTRPAAGNARVNGKAGPSHSSPVSSPTVNTMSNKQPSPPAASEPAAGNDGANGKAGPSHPPPESGPTVITMNEQQPSPRAASGSAVSNTAANGKTGPSHPPAVSGPSENRQNKQQPSPLAASGSTVSNTAANGKTGPSHPPAVSVPSANIQNKQQPLPPTATGSVASNSAVNGKAGLSHTTSISIPSAKTHNKQQPSLSVPSGTEGSNTVKNGKTGPSQPPAMPSSSTNTHNKQQASQPGSKARAAEVENAPCDSCVSPPKIPRRVKRYAEYTQKDIWGLVHVPLDLVVDTKKTYAVILLYLPYNQRTRIWDKYPKGQSLTDEARAEIIANIQDLMVIASETEETDISKLIDFLPEAYDVSPLGTTEAITDYSFSKCDSSISSFNADGFLLSERTPGSSNKCPVYETVQPFSFKGKVLRKQTQEVVVNVVTNLKEKLGDDAWRAMNPLDAASSILNLSKKTVKKIMTRYEDGDAFSDGKTRCRKRPTTDLDSTQQSILYRCIVEPYSQNRVPRFVNIWKCFVERVRSYQREERDKRFQEASPSTVNVAETSASESMSLPDGDGASVEDDETSVNLYQCSAKSFSKILDKYGYDYGKIRNRDAQVFRPSNLKWRAMYLEAIRKYEADPAWNVIYQDETWIDPHQRPNRGWIRKKYDNFLQRLDFTFKDDKISRGSRLIVLAAGGKEGFIKDATEVYAVPVKRKGCKTQTGECPEGLSQDYHDNVKGPKFQQWLEKLFKILENRPTVFVMDNCPFHKVLAVPKTSDLKETIRKWLEEKKKEGFGISEDVSLATKLTKVQLLAIVHRLTDETSGDQRIPRTQIQQLAARYGHRILHIPPYNCDLNPIEYVWNDIKSQVKEENTEQTVKQALSLARAKLNEYPAEEWRKKIANVRKREDEYLVGDKVFAVSTDEEVISAEPLSEEDLTGIEQEAGLISDCVEPE